LVLRSCATRRFRDCALPDAPATEGRRSWSFINGVGDVRLLAAQVVDPFAALGDGDAALFDTPVAQMSKIDHIADFGEAETYVLGAHDPCQPRPVALAVDARQAQPRRRDQALVLIEAQGARGNAELVGEIGNRILIACARVRMVEMAGVVTICGGGLSGHAHRCLPFT
jgi:hypothetical protein